MSQERFDAAMHVGLTSVLTDWIRNGPVLFVFSTFGFIGIHVLSSYLSGFIMEFRCCFVDDVIMGLRSRLLSSSEGKHEYLHL